MFISLCWVGLGMLPWLTFPTNYMFGWTATGWKCGQGEGRLAGNRPGGQGSCLVGLATHGHLPPFVSGAGTLEQESVAISFLHGLIL